MTSYEEKELAREVRAFVEERMKADGRIPITTSWIVQEIVTTHLHRAGTVDDWFVVRAYSDVRNVVQKHVRSLRASEADVESSTGVLPGFTRMQTHYSIQREDESVIVSVWEMSVEELQAKREELAAMRDGLDRHVEELDRFIATRADENIA